MASVRKYSFLFFVLFIFLFPALAEGDNRNVLQPLTLELQKIEKLNQLSIELLNQDPEKALRYAERALKLAYKINDPKAISNSLQCVGDVYLYNGEHNTALSYFYNALKIARLENYKVGIKSSLNNLGVLYYRIGDYKNSLFYHFEALKMKKEMKDLKGIHISLNNIGMVHQKLKDYENASKYYSEALGIIEKLDKPNLLVSTINNMGSLYSELGNDSLAIENFQKSVFLSKKTSNLHGLATAYTGLGQLYEMQGKNYRAALYYNRSLKLSQEIQDKNSMSRNYNYLSRIQFVKQDYDQALELLDKSHKIAEDSRTKERLMENYELYSKIHDKLGEYEKAFNYQNKFIDLKNYLFNEKLARSLTNIQMEIEEEKAQEVLAMKDLELNENRAKTSFLFTIFILTLALVALFYTMYKSKNRLYDKLQDRNNEILSQKKEIESQKESLVRNNVELEKAQQVIKEQNDVLNVINVQLESIVKSRTKELKATNVELEMALKELDTFIYKTSHDIRGPLARLMGLCNVALMDVEDSKSLDYFKMLNGTANYLNSMLARLSTVSDIKNMELKNEYIDFDELTQSVLAENSLYDGFKKIRFNVKVNKSMNFYSDYALVKLIMHNLIENAIKFHRKTNDNVSFVSVEISRSSNKLYINVSDNGIGINKAEFPQIFEMFSPASGIHQTAGLGLYMVKLGVEKLSGKITLLERDPNLTEFEIEIPCQIVGAKKVAVLQSV